MKNFKNKIKNIKGITLISLIVTIIVLIILAGVTLNMLLGENGIINRTKTAKEENEKATATETMNLKITNVQISTYVEKQRMPTLKELADNFCDDNDFDKVIEKTEVGSLAKINNENPTAIIAKLKAYPYEFEINNSLQLAGIDGVKVANENNNRKTFIIYLDGNEINYFPEITSKTKLVSASASNGAKIEFNESNSSFQISNLSDLNTTFQLNYMTINDYKKLITLAGINENYNNINELISNSSALEKIFDSNNATQYLIESNELIDAIKNSETAIQNIASSKKLMYKTIINDTIKQAVLSSSYSSLIDNAAVKVPILSNNDDNKIIYTSSENENKLYKVFDKTLTGDYQANDFANSFGYTANRNNDAYECSNVPNGVGYNFNKDLICYKILYIGRITTNPVGYGATVKKYKIQGSNNGNDWEDIYIGENNDVNQVTEFYIKKEIPITKSYKMFRFYVIGLNNSRTLTSFVCNELQFYCVESN